MSRASNPPLSPASLETLTFDEDGGTTTLRGNTVFPSVDDRDAMVQSGMQSGLTDSMERLDELLATLGPVG